MNDFIVIDCGDKHKEEVQKQWNNDPCGSHYAKESKRNTLEWYLDIERYRYEEYAPWMLNLMEFFLHSEKKVLEIGAGVGTDLSQFAKNGAIVTDFDLSRGHLEHAKENFKLRNLKGEFYHGDAETLPFADNTFDVVYSNGVIHHTPNTNKVISEINRVLKPGGKTIIMVYAFYSWHYFYRLLYEIGFKKKELYKFSINEIMSRSVEISETAARPLVKVYTARQLKEMFSKFKKIKIFKRQLIKQELPCFLKKFPVSFLQRFIGWNLIIKAYKD